jgi:L-arabinose isomerase
MSPSVALVGIRTSLFDDSSTASNTDSCRAKLESIKNILREHVDLTSVLYVDSEASAANARISILGTPTQLIILIPLSAVPPKWAADCIPDNFPVIVWDTSTGMSLNLNSTQKEEHQDTSAIGTIMSTSGLRLRGISYFSISETVDGPIKNLLKLVNVAKAVANMKNLRVLRIGRPIRGYDTITNGSGAFAAIGLNIIDATGKDIRAIEQRVNVGNQLTDEDLSLRSENLASSIEDLGQTYDAHAIALNCHGDIFRENKKIGIVACWAASIGKPTTCTADVPTAWILSLITELTGSAVYCEPYSVDDSLSGVLLANCGIGSPPMARSNTWRRIPSQYYPGLVGRGSSVAMTVKPGPATYVAVRPDENQWDLIAIEDEVLIDSLSKFGVAHAYFRLNQMSPRDMLDKLSSAGVVHHGALGLGLLRENLQLFSTQLTSLKVSN